jgi:hypothetical protein
MESLWIPVSAILVGGRAGRGISSRRRRLRDDRNALGPRAGIIHFGLVLFGTPVFIT